MFLHFRSILARAVMYYPMQGRVLAKSEFRKDYLNLNISIAWVSEAGQSLASGWAVVFLSDPVNLDRVSFRFFSAICPQAIILVLLGTQWTIHSHQCLLSVLLWPELCSERILCRDYWRNFKRQCSCSRRKKIKLTFPERLWWVRYFHICYFTYCKDRVKQESPLFYK